MDNYLLTNFRGEIAALGTAFLWASASSVYTILGTKIPALLLNFLKGIVGLFFIILVFCFSPQSLENLSWFPVLLLIISGMIGIGIGDTAYFQALNNLGARKTLLLETLAPPLTTILGWFFLNEKLLLKSYLGILITIMGVAWVISERNPEGNQHKQKRQEKKGMQWILLDILCQASGALIARYTFYIIEISPLLSSFFRLVGGTIILLFFLGKKPVNYLNIMKNIWSIKIILLIIITAFGSTFLGIWLQQVALKFAPVGIAQTLLATSPLFIIPIAMILGEKISLRAIVGVLVSLLGISLLFTA